jgi:hypothetical protein
MTKHPDWHQEPIPELTPQPIPTTEEDKRTPIDVINGALDEINRREREEEEGGGATHKPTIH